MKLNIQLFGGRGASSSQSKAETIKTKTTTITKGEYEGDVFKTKYITDKSTNTTMGQVDYIVNNEETMIQMITIYNDFRRKGYATQLLKELQKEVGDKDINFDMLTEDGKALISKIGTITEEKKGKYGVSHYKGRIKL